MWQFPTRQKDLRGEGPFGLPGGLVQYWACISYLVNLCDSIKLANERMGDNSQEDCDLANALYSKASELQ